MKTCAYCGRDNEDTVAACCECGTDQFTFVTQSVSPASALLDQGQQRLEEHHAAHPCTLCEGVPVSPCDERSVQELTVLDYRTKSASFTGFPSGETHTVQGWKLTHNRSIETYVCSKCADQHFAETKRSAPLKAAIAVVCTVALLGIIVSLINDNTGGRHFWIIMGLAFVAVPVMLLVCAVQLFAAFAKKDLSYDLLHGNALQKLLGVAPRFCNPGDYPKFKGATFQLSAKNWASAAPEIAHMEERTGWSHFHYLREYAYNSETCTQEQGAAYLKVDHLGQYLESA